MSMRRISRQVLCGDVPIGGGAPVTIQSMTSTDTRDIEATAAQIQRLEEAGCQIVRCAVPDMEAAAAIGSIRKKIHIPLVADIHFDHRLAIESIRQGADKIRINPGNMPDRDHVRKIISEAKSRSIPIRIGVNSGSLEKDLLQKFGAVTAEGLAESALRNIALIEGMGFEDIVVSIKSPHVRLNYEAHLILAEKTIHPMHIGITESGTPEHGKVKSAVGIGALLLAGIGDTIRVSLTGDPVSEVLLGKEILKAAGLIEEGIEFISCPTCGRCSVDMVKIASQIEQELDELGEKKHLTVAVMGCEVNGPGEAREADIGIAFGKGKAVMFRKGIPVKTLPVENIKYEFIKAVKELLNSNEQ